jgi:threonine dehydratase
VIDSSDIRAARKRIAKWIRRTPMVPLVHVQSPVASDIPVFLKLECLQVTGSFKARGAMNAALAVGRGRYVQGLVTASGGNHG